MNPLNNHETVNLLNKVKLSIEKNSNDLTDLPMQDWPAKKITEMILKEVLYFRNLTDQEGFESIKHGVLSQEFRYIGIYSVDLTYTFDATTFGQLNEYFHWNFTIEEEDSENKTMKDDVDKKIAEIQEDDKNYNETPGSLRYNNIITQSENIKSIFIFLKNNIPNMEDENIIPILALILLDMEKMSISRQNSFLSYQKMQSREFIEDKWTSCLIIDASYRKPNIVLNSFKSLKKKKDSKALTYFRL